MVYVKNTITFLSYFILISLVANSEVNIIGDFGCSVINCGEGKCITTDTMPFFECKCNPGWIQVSVFNLSLPTTPCIVPNCSSLNLSCGLPAIPLVLPSNISDPCATVWCGDGTCAHDGIKHRCDCAAGAYNLLNQTDAPCFQECFVGSKCNDVPLGLTPPPAPTAGASGPSKGGHSSGSSRKWMTFAGYMGSLITLFFAIC